MTKKVRDAVRRQKSRRRHIVPAFAAFCRVFLFTLVFGGSLYGVYRLWTTAAADPRFRMDGETLALAGAVRECPESVAELEALGKRFTGRSLFDPTLVSDMRRAYGESVWVKKITHIRRRFPNRVDVEFLIRMPAAQVWHDNKFWLVDNDAALLPVPGSRDRFAALPEIVGVTSDIIGGRPKPGGQWRDPGVAGALGILRAFWGSPLAEALPVGRVVVNAGAFGSGAGRDAAVRRRFEVVTESGAVVRWGTFNPGDVAGELTNSEKLWHLQDLMRREEALRPGVCFDIRTALPGYSMLPPG